MEAAQMTRAYRLGYSDGYSGFDYNLPREFSVKDAHEYELGFARGQHDRENI